MCGICGLIGYKKDAAPVIHRMNERMIHRGPDDEGIYISDDHKVALGHRRLAIVELSKKGAQPMTSLSGRFTLVYNGEIYNAGLLREKLLSVASQSGTVFGTCGAGITFRGSSDTEVLLESIERFGVKKTLETAKGMFGFAIYDRENNTVTLARDRVGEKPLYYGYVGGAFAFASDLGSIRVIDGFDNAINTDVLDIYFRDGYIPAPYSIYRDIYKLDAGKILTINVSDLTTREETCFSMAEIAKKGSESPFDGSPIEAADELERLLKESVKGQMIADVPLGAFLSAGIDSSTIVSIMQSVSDRKVRTFTIGMEDERYNEAKIAGEIASHLGTDHTELYITEADAKAVIPGIARMFAEPFADSSQIPTFLVSKMTRQYVTVSLSGDGGDELFCGYNSYESVGRIWGKLHNLPYPVRKATSSALLAAMSGRIKSGAFNQTEYAKAVYLVAKSPSDVHRMEHLSDPLISKISLTHGHISEKCMDHSGVYLGDPLKDVRLMDMLVYHPDDILVKVDRTAMAVSLESRVPMLDKDILEFAFSLPTPYLRDEKTSKKVLRDVLYRYVPREMMDRPKKGFSIPIAKWLLEPDLRSWAEDLLDEKKVSQSGILDSDVVHKIWTDFTEKGIYRVQIWYILMFLEWYEDEYRHSL
ncbi:MAG: asparagine synthase (glutamine-hydrolyzing) [Butyrivibrio sp.]|nr:asparagine synthase (glutamine-hydrolyzing) [Butyrivibrio sp.]